MTSERTALYRLYDTTKTEGLQPFLQDLYPQIVNSWHYLGTAGSCPNGGPGLSYYPCDWESDNVVALRLEIRWGTPVTPVPTALYRLHNKGGTLLYVGISDAPERRWVQHAYDKPWWSLVADLSMKWFPSRERALEAETQAIRTERPLHNFVHNHGKTQAA